MLQVYNTLTRQVEEFKPLVADEVRMYSCGPTVYAPPHIGNYRSFLFADLLRRYLEYKGFQVVQVMNLTDIDDKTIRDSAKEDISLKAFTEKYEKTFFEGVDFLNIKRASYYPRATENVDGMVEMTRILIERGYAYVKDGSVYFDISKFKNYGQLSKLELKELKPGTRVDLDEYAKESPSDFALMKKSTPQEVARGITYRTPWSNMRPGWHIECSVLSMKYLGKSLDIHTGGIDLIFPHHENEIAQSEAYTGTKFVNYWLHCEHLLVNGQKMAKSLRNFVTLQDLISKGYDARAIRLLLISTHYRRQLNFTFEALEASVQTVQGLANLVERLREAGGTGEGLAKSLIDWTRSSFEAAMDDDLDVREALSAIFNFATRVNRLLDEEKIGQKDAKELLDFLFEVDMVLGLRLEQAIGDEILSEEVKALVKRREDARSRADWKTADEIRSRLKEMGVILEDTSAGAKWKVLKKGA
jgi:cysteinyl-tRNA synthetase